MAGNKFPFWAKFYVFVFTFLGKSTFLIVSLMPFKVWTTNFRFHVGNAIEFMMIRAKGFRPLSFCFFGARFFLFFGYVLLEWLCVFSFFLEHMDARLPRLFPHARANRHFCFWICDFWSFSINRWWRIYSPLKGIVIQNKG